jgi:hypothetical protein
MEHIIGLHHFCLTDNCKLYNIIVVILSIKCCLVEILCFGMISF